jgi:hypothetical protein
MSNYNLRKIEDLAAQLAGLLEETKDFHWSMDEAGIKAESNFIDELYDLAYSANMTVEAELNGFN